MCLSYQLDMFSIVILIYPFCRPSNSKSAFGWRPKLAIPDTAVPPRYIAHCFTAKDLGIFLVTSTRQMFSKQL
jgi:hypothetical protein